MQILVSCTKACTPPVILPAEGWVSMNLMSQGLILNLANCSPDTFNEVHFTDTQNLLADVVCTSELDVKEAA
jgi:hypothetical protein